MIKPARMVTRSVRPTDRGALKSLIYYGNYVHQHMDWRAPEEWFGWRPFVVLERNHRVVAALACPPDPPDVAWIRVFAVAGGISMPDAWQALWNLALEELSGRGNRFAALPVSGWFQRILEESGFVHTGNVVLLEWKPPTSEGVSLETSIRIRLMEPADLPAVQEVDQAAFAPLWRLSLEAFQRALPRSSLATVAEDSGAVVGYQMSTASTSGGHLARLAVHPSMQGQGIGRVLLADVLQRFQRWGALRVTVNTQEDNETSLALYCKAGFRRTEERYPVYELDPGVEL